MRDDGLRSMVFVNTDSASTLMNYKSAVFVRFP